MTNVTAPKVLTLQYFEGCPNWKITRDRLGQAMELAGSKPKVVLEPIETADDAERRGFRGSPTVLVDGVDPFADETAPTGLSCRVYRTENGREGSPSMEQLLSVLQP